ncbi:MAG: HAMP domain-containing histidine kinase [Coriobacteriales bacterium]|jgi:two-component system OmpR family sensor kinase|nr:HAMP domain-containing histidine kinase [Coriobacteriales bacterium]
MQYRTLRILLALISAAVAVILAFAIVVVLLTIGEPQPWVILVVLCLGLVTFLCTYAATGIYLGPLGRIQIKAKQLADGQYSVHFVDDRITAAPLGVQELADSLETVAARVRLAIAEAAVEGKRQRQFISDVSHELRTPLTAIRGAAETMMDEDIPYEDRRHFAETIVRESERLTRLANDLLTLQRIEGDGEIVLQRVDLHDVVENVSTLLSPLLDERQVELSVKGEAPDVLGDPDRLQQVVQNLVDNASRFVGSGGHVNVTLSGIRGHSVITVADDGPGFGDINPVRLFDRFYRGDSSRARTTGGTGLGLTIVKAIVAAHDGTVEAFNLPDGGACFIVAIPSVASALS